MAIKKEPYTPAGLDDKSYFTDADGNRMDVNAVKDTYTGAIPNTDVINSSLLAPQPTSNFQTYNEPAPYDISKLTPTLGMTQPEQKADAFSKELEKVNAQLLGESSYRASQETAQGMPELLKTQTDLSAQLKALQNDAKAIPLQAQQQAEGRGITAGGLAPIQTSRLRNNAIQALTVNSLLEASNGNIATAQTLVDRAVAQKYDPVREKIAVLAKNLELIRDSESYKQADRERAQAQLDIQNAKLDELAKEEAEQKEIWNLANEAARSGVVDAQTLTAIKDAKTKEEALQIATDAGVFAKSGEGFTLSPGQVRYDAQGNPIAQAEELPPTEMEQIQFQMDIAKNQAEIDKIYNDIAKGDEIDPLKQLQIQKLQQEIDDKQAEADQKKIQQGQSADVAKEKYNDIKELIDNADGIRKVAGTGVLGRTPVKELLTGGLWTDKVAANYSASIKQLISQQTLDTLTNLKAKGGTLGALSDQERIMLQNAATKLGSWEIKDDNGNGTGRWDIDEASFKAELDKIQSLSETAYKNATGAEFIDFDDFLEHASNEQLQAADTIRNKYPGLTDDDLIELMNGQDFNQVGSDTNTALPKEVSKVDIGEKEGQCGRFVNKYTGLGLGDSYSSKLAKMDKSITQPKPGMVFVMPYKDTGHAGFILGINGDKAIVKDSNYSLDEKVQVHEIPISKITGLTYA